MRPLFHPCGNYRESLCLLAAGALPPEDREALESHLAACENCRGYRDEMNTIAGPLANWEAHFVEIQPSRAAQARWERDLATALKANCAGRMQPLFDWCKEMIWPCRRIWAGLAAVWLLLLAVNLAEHDPAQKRWENLFVPRRN